MKPDIAPLVAFVLALHLPTSSFAGKNPNYGCTSRGGSCKATIYCDGGITLDGECPNEPAHVKCCIMPSKCNPSDASSYCGWTDRDPQNCAAKGKLFLPGTYSSTCCYFYYRFLSLPFLFFSEKAKYDAL